MLRSLERIIDYQVVGLDGELGELMDVYFDERDWMIRYLVLDTRGWLPERDVLISPEVAGEPDYQLKQIRLNLTHEQVRKSPPIWSVDALSRQHEEKLAEHFHWHPWWLPVPDDFHLELPYPSPGTGARHRPEAKERLRSLQEIKRYKILDAGGEKVGRVADLVSQTSSWQVHYIVVKTSRLLRHEQVLVAPSWIKQFDWLDETIQVDHSRAQIEESPKFDPAAPVNREYEAMLFDYYGRPRYWES